MINNCLFSVFPRFEQGYCYFGKKCTFAHGQEECNHWKSLYKEQAAHLTHFRKRQLLTESFEEKVRLRIKHEGLDHVVSKRSFYVLHFAENVGLGKLQHMC